MTDTLLATVDQLALWLQLPLASDDPTATLYLEAASGLVTEYLEQQLTQTLADVVVLDPINGAYVFLPERPVTAVTLLEILDSTQSPPVWTTADPSTYEVSLRLGAIAGLPGCGVYWPSAPGTWRVTYDHGYETIPSSLVSVVLGVAARAYSSPASIEQERLGGYQVKYAVEASGFSALELVALNKHKETTIS